MTLKHKTIKYGVISFLIYITFLMLFGIYFNTKSSEKKPIHFVKKNETVIDVKTIVDPKPKPKPKPKVEPKVKKKVKKVIKKEKKIKNVEVKKKIKNLFDDVVVKDDVKKVKPVKKKVVKKKDKGVVNKYFAQIEDILYSWPAQSSFAGEKANVWMTIKQNGSFTFKIKSSSGNIAFNNALIEYLKQLQSIKLPKHTSNKAYNLKVEFTATQ